MKKGIKILFTIILGGVVFYLAFLVQTKIRSYEDYQFKYTSEIYDTRDVIEKSRYIIHAGGFIEGKNGERYDYTNSKDALLNAYEQGNRVIEIDFMKAADGKIICGHNDENWCKGIDSDKPLSSVEFEEAKIYGEFQTMSLSELIQFMRKHDDLYIVTDVKDGNNYFCMTISQECPDLKDRFIIQIYHKEEYEDVYYMGFHKIIYTLYKSSEKELQTDVLQNFAKDYPLVGFTFFYYIADDEDFFSGMQRTKVPLYVHTLNDEREIEQYFSKGISAIYTDVVDWKN